MSEEKVKVYDYDHGITRWIKKDITEQKWFQKHLTSGRFEIIEDKPKELEVEKVRENGKDVKTTPEPKPEATEHKAEEQNEQPEDETDYSNFTKADLVNELKERGENPDTRLKKQDLINKLKG